MGQNLRSLAHRTSCLLAWAAVLALPTVALADPPVVELGRLEPGSLAFFVFWVMELLIFVAEALAYQRWAGLPQGRAFLASGIGNIASLVVGSAVAWLLGAVGAWVGVVTLMEFLFGVMAVELPIVARLNRKLVPVGKMYNIALLVNLVTFAALIAVTYAVGELHEVPHLFGQMAP